MADESKKKPPASPPLIPKPIAAAIIDIQKTLQPMIKTAENDSFGNSYVPLEDVTLRAHELLSKHNIGVMQPTTTDEYGHAALETILFTATGESFSRTTKLALEEVNPQAHGSAITYTRRYALMATLGLTGKGDDDDGNKAAGVFAPVQEEQKDRLRSLMKYLKYPKTAMANEIFNIKTRDHAYIAIKRFEETIAMRARDEESKENASEVEFGKKIAVTDAKGTKEPAKPAEPKELDPLSLEGFQQRLKDLKLASKSYETKVVLTGARVPFLEKVMEKKERIVGLDTFLKALESGVHHLEPEFYAPSEEPRIVEEKVA